MGAADLVAKRPPQTAAATKAVNFIRGLTHSTGEWAGQPFRLRPWQEAILRRLFGTLRDDGTRQYRTAYIEIPRKNGKTELAAAMALYMLIGDRESGAEVYGAAVDREQASLVFRAAERMVRHDPELAEWLEIIPSTRRIRDPRAGGVYRAIPGDAPSQHGYNASAIIYDELHAAPNRDLWDVLTTSMGARRQPLTVVITTAGWDRDSICWELHAYAERVRDGSIVDPTFLPVLYGAPLEADWLDERVWRAANPALGDFRSLDEMRVAAQQAREVPARQNTFRRLYLCQWTESSSRWLDPAQWAACAGPIHAAELPAAMMGRSCVIGLDLSSTTDITMAVAVFADGAGGYDVIAHGWLPEDDLHARMQRDRAPYALWAQDGYLTLTPGARVDYGAVRAWLQDWATAYPIQEIAYDPWNATGLVAELSQDGATCVEIRQGFGSLSAPSKALEALLAARAIRHGGNPILSRHAGAAVVRQDPAGNIKPDKARSGERIDGIVALVTALARATVLTDANTLTNALAERGLLVV